jgi:hypothetical protein
MSSNPRDSARFRSRPISKTRNSLVLSLGGANAGSTD